MGHILSIILTNLGLNISVCGGSWFGYKIRENLVVTQKYDNRSPGINRMNKLLLLVLSTLFAINSHPIQTYSNDELGMNYDTEEEGEHENLIDTETESSSIIFAKEDKRLFEDYLENQSNEERLQRIRELKEKNKEDQKRRRAERRRRRKSKNRHGEKVRVNRNTKR